MANVQDNQMQMLAFSKARTRNNVPIIPFTTRTPSLARERAASCRQRHALVCTEEITAPHPAPCLPWHPHPYPNATTNLPLHNIHPFGPPDFLHHSTHAHTHCYTMPLRTHHREERLELKWVWTAKWEQSHPPPPPPAFLLALLCASLLIQPLWSVQPLIWTKIREFDPHFKEVGTQGLFSCTWKKKPHFDYKSIRWGLRSWKRSASLGLSVCRHNVSATHWQRRLLYWRCTHSSQTTSI